MSGFCKDSVSSKQSFHEVYDEYNDFVIIDENKSSGDEQSEKGSISSVKANDFEDMIISFHSEDGDDDMYVFI